MIFTVAEKTAILVCYSFVFLLGVVGNICVLLTILTSSRFRKTLSNILISDLALADLFLCLISAPYHISNLAVTQPPQHGSKTLDSVCKAYVVSAYSLGFTRILLLAIISLERFVAIIHPFFYQKYYSLGGLRLAIICGYTWFHSLVCTSPAAFMQDWIKYEGKPTKLCGYAWENANLGFVLPLFTLNFLLPLCVIVYTNCKVYITARQQSKRIAATFRMNSPTEIPKTTCSEELFTAKDRRQRKFGRQEFLSPLPVLSATSDLFPGQNTYLEICNVSQIGAKHNRRTRQGNSVFGENERQHHENMKIVSLESPLVIRNEIVTEDSEITSNGNSKGLLSVGQFSSTGIRKISVQSSKESAREYENSHTETSSLTDGPRTYRISVCSKPADSRFKGMSRISSNSGNFWFGASKRKTKWEERRNSQSSLAKLNKYRWSRFYRRNTSPSPRNVNIRGKTKDFVVFFSTLSVVSLFLLTWLPFAIMTIALLVTGTVISEKADVFISMITVIDSAFTPFIVLGTRREFRKVLFKKFFRRSPLDI